MQDTHRARSRSAGFTLVELLIAALVFTLAVAGVLQSIFSSLYLKETARNSSQAVFHLNNMMERMRATAFNSLTTQFPNGTQDGPAANRYTAVVGGYTLRNEHITVTYPNAAGDPREINATCRWTDSRNRAYNLSVSTMRTR
jgi:Tfp pilus assembly protein PilV